MKKRILFIIFIALSSLFFSCHKKQLQKKPQHLISNSKMVDIITDMYLIEGAIHVTPNDSNKMVAIMAYYENLYINYDVTKEQIISSLYYYLSDEDQANKMLSEASERLKEMKERESEE